MRKWSLLSVARRTKHAMLVAGKRQRRSWLMVREAAETTWRIRMKAAQAGMKFDGLPRGPRVPGSVWAVAMVRNEADIIADTVAHLFRQGVDGVLVADNGSTDATLEVLHDLAGRYPLYVGTDSEPAYYQAQKMTLLARLAAECGADWIVPFDADEWWFGAAGERLVDTLRRSETGVAAALLFNCYPPVAEAGGPEWRFDPLSARLTKVAFRWRPLAALQHGNHAVFHPDQSHEILNILHFPWRRFEQFQDKVRHGMAALEGVGKRTDGAGDHWQVLGRLSDEELRSAWESLLQGKAPESFLWVPQGPLAPITPGSWEVWPTKPGGC